MIRAPSFARSHSLKESRRASYSHAPLFKRLSEDFENIAGEFRKLVEKQHAVVGHADFAGAGNGAASDETGGGYRVMRRAKRPRRQSAFGWEETGDGVNPSGLETFLEARRRQNRGDAFREHGLAGAERSDKQHVVDTIRAY